MTEQMHIIDLFGGRWKELSPLSSVVTWVLAFCGHFFPFAHGKSKEILSSKGPIKNLE